MTVGFDHIMTGEFDRMKYLDKEKLMMNIIFAHHFCLNPDYLPQIDAKISPIFYLL